MESSHVDQIRQLSQVLLAPAIVHIHQDVAVWRVG